MPEDEDKGKGTLVTACSADFWRCGCILGVVLSWEVNKSIIWASLHGICSWLYVIYYVIAY